MSTPQERFMAKVTVSDPCWIWHGSADRYGFFRYDGRTQSAHRVAYQMFIGPIPEGLTIDHVVARGCTSTLCVNPDHLEAVTQRVNTLRAPNAPATINATKTQCPQEHEYTDKNTYIDKLGKRSCRICNADRARARRDRARQS